MIDADAIVPVPGPGLVIPKAVVAGAGDLSTVMPFLILGPSFYYMDPIFDCKSETGYVDEEVACPKLSECRLVNDYTIVAYAGLYCDQQSERSMIQSALPIGSFFGLLLMNYLSDQKGRKVAIVLDMFIGLLACLRTISLLSQLY